nr:MAG TPA: hypothetical protein [Caudoviricetes sp.]
MAIRITSLSLLNRSTYVLNLATLYVHKETLSIDLLKKC